MFDRVAIVGVGLIGGSIGLAIKRRGLARLVMGVVRRRSTLAKALRHRALHAATMSLKEGVRGADLVILSAPVSTILQQIKTLKPFLSPNAVVIDVASSKTLIDLAARKYLKGVRFTGCHPMAGSAKTGILNADADLFEDAVCFMTNTDAKVKTFWNTLGSRVQYLTPEEHDDWAARVSHLPHILAFALFQSGGAQKLTNLGITASNPSIQDLARLSKSDPKLWADILVTNQKEILRALVDHERGIAVLKRALSIRNFGVIEKFIKRSNAVSHRLCPGK
mgnify:CR=1 FL=1